MSLQGLLSINNEGSWDICLLGTAGQLEGALFLITKTKAE